MAALDYLYRAGLAVEANGDTLRLRPVELITDAVRQFVRDHKAELLAELAAANDPMSDGAWLHLLALADGRVIQRAGDMSTAHVERDARQQHGENLLAVVPVPGFERPLSEAEIVKALAGTLVSPALAPAPSSIWLARVARLLGVRTADLLEHGHLERQDLIDLAGADVTSVAEAIRCSPAWLCRQS